MQATGQWDAAILEAVARISKVIPNVHEKLPHLVDPLPPFPAPFDYDNKIASVIDHTLLNPQGRRAEVVKLCQEAAEYGFAAVCVNGGRTKLAIQTLQDLNAPHVKVAAVIGFPLGAGTSASKAFETKELVDMGAHEIDMVINVGMLMDGEYEEVAEDIAAVVHAAKANRTHPAVVKVILECGSLSKVQIIEGCILSVVAGADFVKTSTGFIPAAGGAKVEDVHLMKTVVGDKALVKASGGVGTYEAAKEMVNNGAARIGASKGVVIVAGEKAPLPSKQEGEKSDSEERERKRKREEAQAEKEAADCKCCKAVALYVVVGVAAICLARALYQNK